jgi:hypothetical protein
MSHFILSALNGAWFVTLGLVAWAGAYLFLTRVITPESIGDLMTLIAAVLPLFSALIALVVAGVSFFVKPRHVTQGTVFTVILVLAGIVVVLQYRDSEIRRALSKAVRRSHPLQETMGLIFWGSAGAILVFASEFGLIFGGWQLLQGSKVWGFGCAGIGAVFVIASWVGGSPSSNPFRKAILALKDDDADRSVPFIKRLLAPVLNG